MGEAAAAAAGASATIATITTVSATIATTSATITTLARCTTVMWAAAAWAASHVTLGFEGAGGRWCSAGAPVRHSRSRRRFWSTR